MGSVDPRAAYLEAEGKGEIAGLPGDGALLPSAGKDFDQLVLTKGTKRKSNVEKGKKEKKVRRPGADRTEGRESIDSTTKKEEP